MKNKSMYSNILKNHVLSLKGTYDLFEVIGCYGISWNYSLDYFTLYKISDLEVKKGFKYINEFPTNINYREYNQPELLNDYAINEHFFQETEQYFDIFGKNFLENRTSTQFKKIRAYFKD